MGVSTNLQCQREFELAMLDPKGASEEIFSSYKWCHVQFELLIDAAVRAKLALRCRDEMNAVV